MVRVIAAVVALVAFPLMARAQESRVYVGGTFNLVTQTHSDREPIGGTTQGGSALFWRDGPWNSMLRRRGGIGDDTRDMPSRHRRRGAPEIGLCSAPCRSHGE